MFSGFDFGTSNCAIGVYAPQADSPSLSPRLLPVSEGKAFMPSMLYALGRELIAEHVGKGIADEQARLTFVEQRAHSLDQANRLRTTEDIGPDEQTIFVGQEALEQYLAFPGEGYFVKSPKSYLGASGLRKETMMFFEDIVSTMMMDIKQKAEAACGKTLTDTVIGRPVNFQGLNAEESNQQALTILSSAAKRAGFKSVEFLYEPLAAGMDFEQQLSEDKTVLVVDIGGGTSDCAMVRMGPSHISNDDRSSDFLGHSGERVGGNDLDIQLAGKVLTPLLGMGTLLKSGLPLPTQPYWDAVSTNDVNAQNRFSASTMEYELDQLKRDAEQPELIARFMHVWDEKLQHRLVRSAELSKIALSSTGQYTAEMAYIESDLAQTVKLETFASAVEPTIARMMKLITEAIQQAACTPDLVYVTGGSAQSPVLRQAIRDYLGEIEVVDGNHFGSVATGLTVWAKKLFG